MNHLTTLFIKETTFFILFLCTVLNWIFSWAEKFCICFIISIYLWIFESNIHRCIIVHWACERCVCELVRKSDLHFFKLVNVEFLCWKISFCISFRISCLSQTFRHLCWISSNILKVHCLWCWKKSKSWVIDINFLSVFVFALSAPEELQSIIQEVKYRTGLQSAKLIRQLRRRDRLHHKLQKNYDIITACLQAVSQKRRKNTQFFILLSYEIKSSLKSTALQDACQPSGGWPQILYVLILVFYEHVEGSNCSACTSLQLIPSSSMFTVIWVPERWHLLSHLWF